MTRKFHLFAALFLAGSALDIAEVAAKEPGRIECTLIVDEVSGDVLHREGICDKAFSPVSSFKLPLAIMGYDAGVLIDAQNPLWDYKPEFDGSKREQKATNPTIWEKDSIVWYSQELTRRLGESKFGDYVQRFNYGNRDVSGDAGKKNGLTHAWLMSSLKISPQEQVAFLRRFLRGELPVSEHAMDMTQAILPHFAAADWDVQGKTGSGWMKTKSGKIDRSRPIGWFVGWAMRDERRVIFARLEVNAKDTEEYAGREARDEFLKALPRISETF